MRWTLARSRPIALVALALGMMPWTTRPPAHAQEARPPAAGQPGSTPEGKIEELDRAIGRSLNAGRIAEAVPPIKEKLDLLVRLRGKDHWETGDARRDVETYERLAGGSREVQDRFAQARRGDARVVELYSQGHYDQALEVCQQDAAILRDILGEDHPLTAQTYNSLAVILNVQGKSAEAEATYRRVLAILSKVLGEDHPETVQAYNNLAVALEDQGKLAEAEAMHRRALAMRLKIFGEDHPDVALSYSNLASTLWEQAKNAEAEAMNRRALAIRIKALGESHPEVATSYGNLAVTLQAQGKYAGAEQAFRRALAIARKAEGEDHARTGVAYNNMAGILQVQGKYAEAEAMDRRALAIFLNALGEGHPDVSLGYNNLAMALNGQGKHPEAEAMGRRALAIRIKALGEDHADTANAYANLAYTLSAQGNHAEAEAMERRALAISLKALGEGHPKVADKTNNLAETLRHLHRYAEAEAMHRQALAIRIKALGEDHPHTATSYHNIAVTLQARGKDTEAEATCRRALAILVKVLGDGHPEVARGYEDLAEILRDQGKDEEALVTWRLAAASDEQARLLRNKGLEGASKAGSPLPGLAAALARAGRPREAWAAWERGLARGLADELTMRATRPLTDAERTREADLLGRAQAVNEQISKLAGVRAPTREQDRALEGLRRQASDLRRDLLELGRQLEARYGALASRPASLDEARGAIPEGTALVGWIDTRTDHWACLLRHTGDPVWVRLAGTGKDGAWTPAEEGVARSLRAELNPETSGGKAGPLADSLARQRLEPLKGHLAGVRRLIVVTSPGLDGVPVEAILAARPGPPWDGLTVSYAPSAAMLAYLAGRPVPRDRPATLLAVADPAYPEPTKSDAPAPEPPAGLALARVVPNGNADLNGIREGDILLRYAGTELKKPGDLKAVASDGGPKKVPVQYWRAGITREAELAAGRLGVVIDTRPAAEFARARHESERVLLGMRGGSRARLPGTRREVEALAALFPDGRASTILGPQACEATVQGLARSGKLKGYRYLHFATHGESDPRSAYSTALILAPDLNSDSGADPTALETDGTITAEQIARTWDLDADLVVLSACESGLGQAAGAEGYLGFAQPLFAKGARSLVLSQWKVDDDATALLMARFYRNLLGKREGLKAPMPKAEALAEAKRWLRGAGPSEVGSALAALPRGEVVRREAVKAASSSHPYEDPTYWAGFVLVGAPD